MNPIHRNPGSVPPVGYLHLNYEKKIRDQNMYFWEPSRIIGVQFYQIITLNNSCISLYKLGNTE